MDNQGDGCDAYFGEKIVRKQLLPAGKKFQKLEILQTTKEMDVIMLAKKLVF